MLPAADLLKLAKDAGVVLDFDALREGLEVTQPMRHARADDEFLAPVAHHLDALRDLDDHSSLLVLDLARTTSRVEALINALYRENAEEASGMALLSPKELMDAPELDECDECGRSTFVRSGIDQFGGTNTPGHCLACGHERDGETADEMAIAAELDRLMAKDD